MIQMGTILNATDNSGAKKVKCVKVLGGSHKMSAGIAEKIVVSVQSTSTTDKVRPGQILDAVVVRTKFMIKRKDGITLKFNDNAVVLFNKDGSMIGTRVFGVIPREIKESGFIKIVSLAQEVT